MLIFLSNDGGSGGGGALIVATRSGPASWSRRARTGAGHAAAPPARRPDPGRRKDGGDGGGGGALIVATRSGPASWSRRARTGAGLEAAPPAWRPGPGRRKGGGGGGGGLIAGCNAERVLARSNFCDACQMGKHQCVWGAGGE